MGNNVSRLIFRGLTGTTLLLLAASVWAQPVLNPGNGTYYEVISGGPWTWQQAADDAQTRSFDGQVGHLVAITSQAENDFLEVDMNIPQNSWIGGMQDPAGSEPDGGWGWITGEAWSFTSWAPGEPNNAGGNEECAHWWSPDGTWNDIPCSNSYSTYVIEYDGGAVPNRATFLVLKLYDDFNPAPVEVTISCNTGLPLKQSKTIDPFEGDFSDSVEFVVKDFESGELDCEISEKVPVGYDGVYLWVDEGQTSIETTPCVFEDVQHGDMAEIIGRGDDEVNDNVCLVINLLQPAEVTVTKEWIDENPQFNNQNFARATYFCSNLPFIDDSPESFEIPLLGQTIQKPATEGNGGGNPQSGSLRFIGDPGEDSFETLPNWDGGTVCDVTEQVVEGGVETDDSDCQDIVLFPGDSGACTIVNTRLYEGIPTLSQYGLGLLALLMLGMGFVAYRRFV